MLHKAVKSRAKIEFSALWTRNEWRIALVYGKSCEIRWNFVAMTAHQKKWIRVHTGRPPYKEWLQKRRDEGSTRKKKTLENLWKVKVCRGLLAKKTKNSLPKFGEKSAKTDQRTPKNKMLISWRRSRSSGLLLNEFCIRAKLFLSRRSFSSALTNCFRAFPPPWLLTSFHRLS